MSAGPRQINADLHCHSIVSDGTLTPVALVRRAHERGVQMLALTDHDELDGLAEAADEAVSLGLDFVPGVEVSVTWGGDTIHVLGLGVNVSDEALSQGLVRTRAGRDERARLMGAALAVAGVPDAYEGALRHVGNPEMVARTHFARYIVEAGVCKNISQVFDRFLSEGKPGFVAHNWATLSEALGWIRGAGGTAVLAHPGRYRLDDTALHALTARFRDEGGSAMEVVCGSHTPDQYRRFEKMALEYGLRGSRGSDFHGPGEGRVDLGDLPPLPDSIVPVWRDWM